ncbi:MAG: hypothetical protein ABSG91_21920 [Syntrophobacteraceae bacterium]
MRSKWLVTSNFERMHELISAVNIVSIHAKLRMAGIEDPTDESKICQAEEHLLAFLDRFQALIADTERQQNGTVIGADPQLGGLALRYLDQKRHLHKGRLSTVSFEKLRDLIRGDRLEDMPELISCMKELRSLLEQHAYVDVVELMGEM